MEIGAKHIAAAVGLFFLGGGSVYLLMAADKDTVPLRAAPHTQHQPAMQEAIEQIKAGRDTATAEVTIPAEALSTTGELTHDSFLEQAEARREQQMINKAEADRLAKLKAAKERSVECKFWKQQQKTSSAAAKIEDKINEHCNLPASSTASEAAASSASNTQQS